MTERFKVGDRVGWNSEAGHVSGMIIRVSTAVGFQASVAE